MINTLKVRQVSKKIDENIILQDVSFSLMEGKIYGFIGKNGSGKTMLFRTMAGLAKCSSGEIYFNQDKVTFGKEMPYTLGILIENAGMYPNFSGIENLSFLASIRKKITKDQIRDAIARVGLDPDDKRKIKKYSLGMRQRITIAQAIMERPQVLLLDEPTNSLDENGVDRIRQVMLEEKERGAIVCLASHNMEDIRMICDEVFEVKAGKVRQVKKDEKE